MRIHVILLVLLISFVSSGCVNSGLSKEDRARIKYIELPKPENILFEKKPRFFSHADGWAMGFGVAIGGGIGAAVTAGGDNRGEEEQLIVDYMLAEPNSISEMLVKSLEQAVRKNTVFEVADGVNRNAYIKLVVENYGIDYVPNSKSYRPSIELTIEMFDETGNSIWRYSEPIQSIHKVTEKLHKEIIFESPETMKNSFEEIIQYLMDRATLHLSGEELEKIPGSPQKQDIKRFR